MAADIVLASASPRRRELLAQLGVRFRVCVADVDETPRAGESATDYAARLAVDKALAGAARDGGTLPALGADTTVVVDGAIVGKPADAADAARMLSRLSGREHVVVSAVALARAGSATVRVSSTRVRFRTLSAHDIARYVATGEPLDKAGAYGIQGFGAALVAWIEGSYSGVVGLPLAETAELLAAAGVPVWQTGAGEQRS